MAHIAVDIDSTLYDFERVARDGFFELALERDDKTLYRGAYDSWQQWRSPADSCGQEIWMEVIARSHDEEIIREQAPYPWAVQTCQELAQAGHQLLYISNRATESLEATMDWLTDHGFVGFEYLDAKEPDVICTMEDKQRHLRFCQYIIDDRPKTLVEFVYDFTWRLSHGPHKDPRKGFGLMYPYNHNLTDIPNVYLAPTWLGLRGYLIEKGVLDANDRRTAGATGSNGRSPG